MCFDAVSYTHLDVYKRQEEWLGTVDLPDGTENENVVAKAFVWEDLNGLKPMSEVEQITNNIE